ncbi:hypothetical protein bas08_0027 [Escherichia phage DanielBernoulli]|uniref:Uncharacterized protein n=1 Tax=Escherichia phage DanielBernoulli TaxID=2851972 RepID=A0AAE8B5Z8_9CAUD|nr:hypothetical protein bas08_0027 [Escherichia phage DanielBernoulli]
MTKSDGVEKVVADLSERAQAIVNGGHQQMDIMKSAFTDFKALGSMSGLLSIMNTGTLNAQQLELASRIAVKVIAVLGIKESEKGA